MKGKTREWWIGLSFLLACPLAPVLMAAEPRPIQDSGGPLPIGTPVGAPAGALAATGCSSCHASSSGPRPSSLPAAAAALLTSQAITHR